MGKASKKGKKELRNVFRTTRTVAPKERGGKAFVNLALTTPEFPCTLAIFPQMTLDLCALHSLLALVDVGNALAQVEASILGVIHILELEEGDEGMLGVLAALVTKMTCLDCIVWNK